MTDLEYKRFIDETRERWQKWNPSPKTLEDIRKALIGHDFEPLFEAMQEHRRESTSIHPKYKDIMALVWRIESRNSRKKKAEADYDAPKVFCEFLIVQAQGQGDVRFFDFWGNVNRVELWQQNEVAAAAERKRRRIENRFGGKWQVVTGSHECLTAMIREIQSDWMTPEEKKMAVRMTEKLEAGMTIADVFRNLLPAPDIEKPPHVRPKIVFPERPTEEEFKAEYEAAPVVEEPKPAAKPVPDYLKDEEPF